FSRDYSPCMSAAPRRPFSSRDTPDMRIRRSLTPPEALRRRQRSARPCHIRRFSLSALHQACRNRDKTPPSPFVRQPPNLAEIYNEKHLVVPSVSRSCIRLTTALRRRDYYAPSALALFRPCESCGIDRDVRLYVGQFKVLFSIEPGKVDA